MWKRDRVIGSENSIRILLNVLQTFFSVCLIITLFSVIINQKPNGAYFSIESRGIIVEKHIDGNRKKAGDGGGGRVESVRYRSDVTV